MFYGNHVSVKIAGMFKIPCDKIFSGFICQDFARCFYDILCKAMSQGDNLTLLVSGYRVNGFVRHALCVMPTARRKKPLIQGSWDI